MSAREPAERIAVRAPNWLGDAVLALEALGDLRESFPLAEIHVYAVPGVDAIAARSGLDLRVRVLPPRSARVRLFRETLGTLRRAEHGLGLVFPPSFSSALLFALGGVARRVGLDGEGRSLLLSKAVPAPPRASEALSDTYRRLVAIAAGLAGVEPRRRSRVPVLAVGESERVRAMGLFQNRPRPWVAIAPGALFGPTKRWPADRFASLARRLFASHGATSVVTGSVGDRAACAQVAREGGAVDLAGRTDLGTLIALFSLVDVVVSNDSGAMHMAGAAGAPVVAIFGSTSPEWTGPRARDARVVRHRVPCAPCYRSSCPIGLVCLTRVEVDEVYAACVDLLGAGTGREAR